MRYEKNYFAKVAMAFTLSCAMASGLLAPYASVYAADSHTVKLQFDSDGDGSIEDSRTVTLVGESGDSIGPRGDIQVRTTYYDEDNKLDYDLISGDSLAEIKAGKDVTLEKDMTFTYQIHKAESLSYQVAFHYVDEENNLLADRFAVVNDKDNGDEADLMYSAPEVMKITEGEKVTYYSRVEAADNPNPVAVNYEADDGSRTVDFTVKYTSNTTKNGYNWYIFLYDAETNQCIDTKTVKVTNEADGTFTPEASLEANGVKYTLNANWREGKAADGAPEEITRAFKDTSSRSTYIYYDPEGYDTSEKTRQVVVRYIDIAHMNDADNGVIQSKIVDVSSARSSTEVVPETITKGSVNYKLVKGQGTSVDIGYFSPLQYINIFYYDENNKEFEHVTLRGEEVVETVIVNGETVYQVIPGVTRIVTVDVAGAPTVQGTVNANGVIAPGGQPGGTTPANPGQVTGEDVETPGGQPDTNIDGSNVGEIETPGGLIDPTNPGNPGGSGGNNGNKKGMNSKQIGIAVGSIAGLAALFLLVFFARKRQGERDHK